MTTASQSPGYCVLLPCSSERSWIVPQGCLGEIVTVAASDEHPPEVINWRGQQVPVLDFGRQDTLPWRDPRGSSGLVAVLLGQRGESCRYFGVAVRGGLLSVSTLADEEIEDMPDAVQDYAMAAFRMKGNIYQVPDLLALQRAIGSGQVVIQ